MIRLLLWLLLTVPALAQQPILLPVDDDIDPAVWHHLAIYDAILIRRTMVELRQLRAQVEDLTNIPPVPQMPHTSAYYSGLPGVVQVRYYPAYQAQPPATVPVPFTYMRLYGPRKTK